jgi:3-deoxy-D-arabino-heptulosonate 7-phosphate (DAHP) synthase
MNLWKPRTAPGYEGVGEQGLPWLVEAAQEGLGVALEVITPEQAKLVSEKILSMVPHAHLILWIGSRNQNHLIQRQIAEIVAGQANTQLMLKNQPWRDEAHWKGMVNHALSGGASKDQLLLCHRGHAPWDKKSTQMRNIPDLEMAQNVKNETSLPMILDPSHIGGMVHLVQKLVLKFAKLDWVDGQIIEVHPDPKNAKTDAKQQLTWDELAELLSL